MHKVIIVGSTRFMRQIEGLAAREALAGHIVLCPHVVKSRVMHAPWTDEQRAVLERVREEEVVLADEVLVANVDGYMGSSTLRLLDLAREAQKPIRFEYAQLPNGKGCLLCNGTGERVRIVNGAGDHRETCPRCGGSRLEPEPA